MAVFAYSSMFVFLPDNHYNFNYRSAQALHLTMFDTIYFNIAGLAGLLLTFLIFVSVHYATSPNWLYLWLNPLCFIGGTLYLDKKIP